MDNCCGGEVREKSVQSMLKSIVDSKLINVEIFSVAVGILFIVVLLKNKFRNCCGT